ncbi:MAG: hypothetical protein J2O48_08175, partial [Solirubrobacterales bacterium]|nr:hypothetical protein [Solirubrobacterales bacterium]
SRRNTAPAAAAAPRPDRGQAAPQKRRKKSSIFRGLLLGVILALILVAVIVFVALELISSSGNSLVHYKQIVASHAQAAIQQIQSFIDQNTLKK